MKAGEVLKVLHISRPTLYRYAEQGLIKRMKLPTGKYDYDEESIYTFLNKDVRRKNVIYGRVSTPNQKKDLEIQVDLLKNWAFNSGYKINYVYTDIASETSFEEWKEFFVMLDEIFDYKIDTVIIATKDRLSNFGFEFISYIFSKFGTKIIVVSESLAEMKEIVNGEHIHIPDNMSLLDYILSLHGDD